MISPSEDQLRQMMEADRLAKVDSLRPEIDALKAAAAAAIGRRPPPDDRWEAIARTACTRGGLLTNVPAAEVQLVVESVASLLRKYDRVAEAARRYMGGDELPPLGAACKQTCGHADCALVRALRDLHGVPS